MVISSVEIRTINPNDENSIKEFLLNAGSSLESFRYFETRPFSVLENHIVTCILVEKDQIIGYGHLDKDNDKIWLGIAIADQQQGKGYGILIMDFLISKAKENKLKVIYLSVDLINIKAKSLYKKFGFLFVKHINETSMLMEYKVNY